jgi:hypothetical protein
VELRGVCVKYVKVLVHEIISGKERGLYAKVTRLLIIRGIIFLKENLWTQSMVRGPQRTGWCTMD